MANFPMPTAEEMVRLAGLQPTGIEGITPYGEAEPSSPVPLEAEQVPVSSVSPDLPGIPGGIPVVNQPPEGAPVQQQPEVPQQPGMQQQTETPQQTETQQQPAQAEGGTVERGEQAAKSGPELVDDATYVQQRGVDVTDMSPDDVTLVASAMRQSEESANIRQKAAEDLVDNAQAYEDKIVDIHERKKREAMQIRADINERTEELERLADSGDFWDRASTAQQIGAILALAFTGLMRPERAKMIFDQVNSIVDQDMEAHKARMTNVRMGITARETAFDKAMKVYGDEEAAADAVRLASYQSLIRSVDAKLESAKTPSAKTAGISMKQQLTSAKEEAARRLTKHELEKKRAKQQIALDWRRDRRDQEQFDANKAAIEAEKKRLALEANSLDPESVVLTDPDNPDTALIAYVGTDKKRRENLREKIIGMEKTASDLHGVLSMIYSDPEYIDGIKAGKGFLDAINTPKGSVLLQQMAEVTKKHAKQLEGGMRVTDQDVIQNTKGISDLNYLKQWFDADKNFIAVMEDIYKRQSGTLAMTLRQNKPVLKYNGDPDHLAKIITKGYKPYNPFSDENHNPNQIGADAKLHVNAGNYKEAGDEVLKLYKYGELTNTLPNQLKSSGLHPSNLYAIANNIKNEDMESADKIKAMAKMLEHGDMYTTADKVNKLDEESWASHEATMERLGIEGLPSHKVLIDRVLRRDRR